MLSFSIFELRRSLVFDQRAVAQSSLYPQATYLITQPALASTLAGIVSPICFAALRLITNSNFVGRSTGRSEGIAPFKILST